MSRTVALSTLREDVQFKADVGGATVRHTPAQITRLINQSIQMFRERISDEGSTHYLVPYSGTLGVGPTSPYAFYQLDLSSGPSPALVRTYGIDVTIDGVVCKLEHVPFESRNDYGTIPGGSRPLAWAHFRTDQVAILPASSSAYPFTVWYLPKFTDLSADADTFDGVAGWEEWVVWDVVCQIIARDQFPQAFAIAEQRRAEIEQRVIRGATKVTQAGGAHVGRDSFGSKLPGFLGGSRPRQAVAGGPYVPAGGSVTDAMLVDMTGPTVKGVLSGTTRPYSIGIGTLTTYLSTFSTTQRGLVPPPLGIGGLFLDDSGAWSAPAGGGGGGSVGPSGAVQFQAGTGMAGASGLRVIGNSPSLLLRLDGSLRVTGGDVAVGSGTTRIQSTSGLDAGGGSIVNVATLVASALAAPAFTDTVAGLTPASAGGTSNYLRADGTWVAPSGAHQFPPAAGATNAQLAVMASGTVKANLSGNAVPSDVAVATLHAFAPTFTATRPGTVPESGGGTSNYLRADGIWDAPPGTSGSPAQPDNSVQFRSSDGTFFGASGISIVGSGASSTQAGGGAALVFGAHDAAQGLGNIRADGDFSIFGTNPSGINSRIVRYSPTGTAGLATAGIIQHGTVTSSRLYRQHSAVGTGGIISWEVGGTGTTALLTQTGMDLAAFHLAAKGLTLTEGITNANLATMSTGTVKATLGGGTPADVPIATLLAFAPTFTSARAGVVPPSDGAATSFLAGDSAWRAPSGGHQFPPVAGATNAQLAVMPTGTVKANLAGNATPSDVPIATLFAFSPTFTATQRGVVPASGGGTSNYLRADGVWDSPPGGSASPGAAIGAVQFNNGAGGFGGASGVSIVASGQALAFGVPSFLPSSGDVRVASGGLSVVHGPGGETVRFLPTGVDLTGFHIKAKSIDVAHLNGLPTDFAALKRFSANVITSVQTGLPSGLSLYPPRGAASGGNRLIIPSGAVPDARTITLRPTGGRAGEVMRIERNGVENFAVTIALPTGTTLHVMPSGTKSWADFMFTKPSGVNFELAGHADMY